LKCHQNKTSIHAAYQTGNFKALQLLLIKIESIKSDKSDKNLSHKFLSQQKNYFNPIHNFNNISTKEKEQEIKKLKINISQNILLKNFENLNIKFFYYFLNFIPLYLDNHLIYLKNDFKERSLKEILIIRDNNFNTPLHLACINGQNDFIKSLKDMEIFKEDLNFFFKQTNENGISPLAYIRDAKISKEILKQFYKKNNLTHMPSVVMELNSDTKDKKHTIDWIINICKSEKLDLILMEHSDSKKNFLLIDISVKNFNIESEKQNLKLKMINKFFKKSFENNDEYINEVEPAFSRHYHQIITNKVKLILDLKLLNDQKIISKIFFTHKPALTSKIKEIWNQKDSRWYLISPFTFFFKYIYEGKKYKYEEIDVIYRYNGEKMALYHAFISYITNNLLIISLPGFIISIYYYKTLLFKFSYFPIYGVLFSSWFAIIIQKWKRKSTEITFQWGITEKSNSKTIRTEYLGDEYYKSIDSHLEKHSIKQRTIILFFASLPIIIFLLGLVVLIFFFTNYLKALLKNKSILEYTPSFLKSLTVTILSLVYDRIALFFVELENHKYDFSYENSLIIKTFMFRLVSDLTAIIYTIFINKNFEDLKVLIYTMILIKMGMHLIVKYTLPFFIFKIKKWRYFNKIKVIVDNANSQINEFTLDVKKKIFDYEKSMYKKNTNNDIDLINTNKIINIINNLEDKQPVYDYDVYEGNMERNKYAIFLKEDFIKCNSFVKIMPGLMNNGNLNYLYFENEDIDKNSYSKIIREKGDFIYINDKSNNIYVKSYEKNNYPYKDADRKIHSAKTIDEKLIPHKNIENDFSEKNNMNIYILDQNRDNKANSKIYKKGFNGNILFSQ